MPIWASAIEGGLSAAHMRTPSASTSRQNQRWKSQQISPGGRVAMTHNKSESSEKAAAPYVAGARKKRRQNPEQRGPDISDRRRSRNKRTTGNPNRVWWRDIESSNPKTLEEITRNTTCKHQNDEMPVTPKSFLHQDHQQREHSDRPANAHWSSTHDWNITQRTRGHKGKDAETPGRSDVLSCTTSATIGP